MAFDTTLLDLMPDTVTLYKAGKRDRYGDIPFAATGTAIRCRYIREPKMVRTMQGEEKISSSHCWLAGVYGVAVEDKVVLPNGDAPLILNVAMFSDERGPYYERVYFI